ncbi:PAS domain-containing sensor histidine kinase [Rhodocyclus tenuis]|uniref:PAS domain-containing sensor histidine kinase n=1 Tax=Rhodocyclus tenuis TaxID=1066 RepID=UPI001903619D|nr:PAS domain S-box protein [Rhodocyclus tenuis]MBK1679256.1 hypothetical protein [Rhodocyclus tenuis]
MDASSINVFLLASTLVCAIAAALLLARNRQLAGLLALRGQKQTGSTNADSLTAALLASEERHAKTFALLPEVLSVSDVESGLLIEVNEAWTATSGFSRAEAIGRTSAELGLWCDEGDRLELLAQLRRKGKVVDHAVSMRHKNGNTIRCEMSGEIFTVQGRNFLLMMTRDITARLAVLAAQHQAEAALRESETKFSRVFQLLPDLAMISDADSGMLIDMNEQWTPMTGWTHAEAIGRSSLDIGFWASPADRREVIRELAEKGQIQRHDIRLRRKNGELFIAEYSGRFFSAGEHRYLISLIADVNAQRLGELERLQALEAKAASERKLRAIFDQAFQLIGTLSLDGILLEVNQAALRLVGAEAAAVLSQPFWEGPWWRHDPEKQRWLRDAIRLAANGEDVRAEVLSIDADKQLRQIDFSLRPLRDDAGRVSMLIAEGRDITALKRTSGALAISEAKFAGAFKASLDSMTISRLDTGIFIEVNEAFERMTGWPRDEAVQRDAFDLGLWPFPEEREQRLALLRKQGFVQEFPCRTRLRTGEIRNCMGNASIIHVVNDRGEQENYLLSVMRDVTEQKRAEEHLRESERKFSLIFRLSPQPLAVAGMTHGRYIDVNDAWVDTLGIAREDAIGHTASELGLWASTDDRARLLEKLELQGSVDRFACAYRLRDGTLMHCLTSGRVFSFRGQKRAIFSFTDVTLQNEARQRIEDINETLEQRVSERTAALEESYRELATALDSLKLTQEELFRAEKMAALGALVAGVAHELNTPIGNGVTVASTLAERTREFVAEIGSGGLRRSTLNDFVDTAKTASELLLRNLAQASELVTSFKQVSVDQSSEQRRSFDLATVIEEVVATLLPNLRKTPYRIELTLAAGITLDSYPGPLGQVISNFINNAVLHAFEGRDSGHMRIESHELDDGTVEIVFSDDGVGIVEENLRRIFDPFFTTRLGRGGSGLGLHIVHNIVSGTLGGRITVDSQSGAGTRFTLTLPSAAPAAKATPTAGGRLPGAA